LRSRLIQRNLEALMRISMEGNDKLSDSDLDTLVDKFKNKKDRYMML
jgi:DNA-binding transcriptional regulator GbsR (MarR family)